MARAPDGNSDGGASGVRTPSSLQTVAASALVGAAAYLATFALVGGLFALDFTRHVLDGGGSGDPVRALQRLGWVVYNVHGVRTEVWLSLNFVELSASELLVPPLAYYAMPPVVLTIGGWLAARRVTGGARRVLAGAGVVVGYLPLATLGALAVRTPEGGPAFVPAVLLAGVVYPVAFGTVGGLLADRG